MATTRLKPLTESLAANTLKTIPLIRDYTEDIIIDTNRSIMHQRYTSDKDRLEGGGYFRGRHFHIDYKLRNSDEGRFMILETGRRGVMDRRDIADLNRVIEFVVDRDKESTKIGLKVVESGTDEPICSLSLSTFSRK